jgi:hypothetical protein
MSGLVNILWVDEWTCDFWAGTVDWEVWGSPILLGISLGQVGLVQNLWADWWTCDFVGLLG